MHFRSLIAPVAWLVLAFAGGALPAQAAWGEDNGNGPATRGDVLRQAVNDGSWVVAQVNDPRVMALEEQVRSLSGQVEELNFLLLQLQEQLRKMQEDNEYRFQQMEGNAGSPQQRSEAPAAQPQPQTQAAEAPGGDAAQAGAGSEPPLAEPPRNLGAIVLNPDGSVKDVTLGEPMELRGPEISSEDAGASSVPMTDDTTVAALPETSDPEQLYGNSYEFILSGDYRTAEAGFRQHVEQFPNDPKTADARYWLGESLLSQDRYAEAAEVFLTASRDFPDARKAPDMLLKLGISLAAMDQKEVACATFREVQTRHGNASGALLDRVRQESALAGC